MYQRIFGAAGLVIFILSACSPTTDQRLTKAAKAITSTVSSPVPVIVKPHRPASPEKSSRTAAVTQGPAPEKLLGMTTAKITLLFGDPTFVRRDPPGEFWRYRSKNCVLELYFYRRGAEWRVDHIEMRNGKGPVVDKLGCVTALRAKFHRR